MSSVEEVLVAVEGGVMTVTINRPKAKNAVNLAVAKGIAGTMERLDADPEVRVAILCGADNTFCAGMDLKAYVNGELPVVPGRGFAGLAEAPPRKPLIAAVEGYALAGGFELVLACDLVVCASNAQFGIPEVKRGLAAGAGGLVRLPRQIPSRIAKELALLGDFVTAQRAYELGMINRIVEPGRSLAVATEMAQAITRNGPLAVMASKAVIDESQDWASGELFARQSIFLDPIFKSADALEGARAFGERRAPVWKGV